MTLRAMEGLQALGRALMLPIAVLPVAGLLLRLGQPDLAHLIPGLDLAFLGAAGGAIFDNLGLLFALGVAVGFSRDGHGSAALSGAIGYLVATAGAKALLHLPGTSPAGLDPAIAAVLDDQARAQAVADLGVPIGIVCGLAGGLAYDRLGAIRLPPFLAFFGGRRFPPIVTGLFGAVLAIVIGGSYAALRSGLDALGAGVAGSGEAGLFVYGALNRLLLVTGLHHILNNVAYFLVGSFHGQHGDLRRFFAGDPTAGVFMAGFFPVMMFGLPAACLAMFHAAPKARRAEVSGLLASMALTSFLTGVTEPVEFAFIFLAPALFVAHALLTGAAFVVMDRLGVRLGYSFSAGFIDWLVNFRLASRPWLLAPVGAVYGAIYYGLFRWAIVRFDLKTPGRDAPAARPTASADAPRGAAFLAALGGAANLRALGACTTRLRLEVVAQAQVDEAALKALGARAVVRPSAGAVQVILGPEADLIATEIGAAMAGKPPAVDRAAAMLNALGGAAAVAEVQAASTRVLLRLSVEAPADLEARLAGMGVLAIVRPEPRVVHLVVGPGAADLAEGLRRVTGDTALPPGRVVGAVGIEPMTR